MTKSNENKNCENLKAHSRGDRQRETRDQPRRSDQRNTALMRLALGAAISAALLPGVDSGALIVAKCKTFGDIGDTYVESLPQCSLL